MKINFKFWIAPLEHSMQPGGIIASIISLNRLNKLNFFLNNIFCNKKNYKF